MNLPQGTYQVEFKFEPKSVAYGASFALVSSLLIFILMIVAAFKPSLISNDYL
jgi:hypothetical protein